MMTNNVLPFGIVQSVGWLKIPYEEGEYGNAIKNAKNRVRVSVMRSNEEILLRKIQIIIDSGQMAVRNMLHNNIDLQIYFRVVKIMNDLKNMSKKEKAEYIWEYYKFHIIGTLVILCIIVSFINSQITKVDYVFNLTMIGNTMDANKVTDLENNLTHIVVKDGEKRKQATVSSIPIDSSSSTGATMSNQDMDKFTVMLAANELDVVILDKTMFESFAKQNIFLRLDNLKQLNLASINNKEIENIGNNKSKAVYAINVENIKIFKDLGFNTDNKVICIINSSKQKYNDILVLKWLLNK